MKHVVRKDAPMTKMINGKVCKWTEVVQQKWGRVLDDPDRPEGEVHQCNYFTPRAYRNQYDRGWVDEGFTYTIGRTVYQVLLSKETA